MTSVTTIDERLGLVHIPAYWTGWNSSLGQSEPPEYLDSAVSKSYSISNICHLRTS